MVPAAVVVSDLVLVLSPEQERECSGHAPFAIPLLIVLALLLASVAVPRLEAQPGVEPVRSHGLHHGLVVIVTAAVTEPVHVEVQVKPVTMSTLLLVVLLLRSIVAAAAGEGKTQLELHNTIQQQQQQPNKENSKIK